MSRPIKIDRVDENRCAGCGMCTQVCIFDNYEMVDKNGKIVSRFLETKCINCGKCIQYCDNSAIVIRNSGSKIDMIDDECDACEKCVLVCKEKNFEVVGLDGKYYVKCAAKEECVGDHYCLFVCGQGALKFKDSGKR